LQLDWRERALAGLGGGLTHGGGIITGDDAIPWYVIQTHCRTENRVQMALQRKGLEVFCPQVSVLRMRRRHKVQVNLPLFQSYLFVHAEINATVFHQIIKVEGVVRLLGNGAPAPLAPE